MTNEGHKELAFRPFCDQRITPVFREPGSVGEIYPRQYAFELVFPLGLFAQHGAQHNISVKGEIDSALPIL